MQFRQLMQKCKFAILFKTYDKMFISIVVQTQEKHLFDKVVSCYKHSGLNMVQCICEGKVLTFYKCVRFTPFDQKLSILFRKCSTFLLCI